MRNNKEKASAGRGKRRGSILLHTLVISVVVAMSSVMVMQWVLSRYIISARTYKSNMTMVHLNGFIALKLANYKIMLDKDKPFKLKYNKDSYNQSVCARMTPAPGTYAGRFWIFTAQAEKDDPEKEVCP